MYLTPFSSTKKGNILSSNILHIIEDSFRGIKLKTIQNITRIDNNKYNVKLKFYNTNNVSTPKNTTLKLYVEVLNTTNISNRVYTSSTRDNIVENTTILTATKLYQWKLIENNVDDFSFRANLGTINSSNSFNVEFNVTASNNFNYHYSDLIRVGSK